MKDINKITKNINPKKVTGPDKIPPKILRLSANIDSNLMNIVINGLSNNSFSNEAKVEMKIK